RRGCCPACQAESNDSQTRSIAWRTLIGRDSDGIGWVPHGPILEASGSSCPDAPEHARTFIGMPAKLRCNYFGPCISSSHSRVTEQTRGSILSGSRKQPTRPHSPGNIVEMLPPYPARSDRPTPARTKLLRCRSDRSKLFEI